MQPPLHPVQPGDKKARALMLVSSQSLFLKRKSMRFRKLSHHGGNSTIKRSVQLHCALQRIFVIIVLQEPERHGKDLLLSMAARRILRCTQTLNKSWASSSLGIIQFLRLSGWQPFSDD